MHDMTEYRLYNISMADPGRGIWGKCPPPHLVEELAIASRLATSD